MSSSRSWFAARFVDVRDIATRTAVLVACAAVVFGAGEARALTLRHTYVFDARVDLIAGQVRASRTESKRSLPRTWERGRPEIPYDIVTFLVPCGSRLVGLHVRVFGEHIVATAAALQTARPFVTDDGAVFEPGAVRLDAAVAGHPHGAISVGVLDGSYPAIVAEPAGGGGLHGYQVMSFRVYPVRWEPATRRVVAVERIELELDVEPGGTPPLQRQRYSEAIERTARRSLEQLVANPEVIAGYERRIGARVERAHGGFHPTAAPSLEGSDVDYVIITNEALAASWQVLADWKTRRGVPTVVRTTEWIQANYRHGSDLQETIRTFVQDAYAKWSVQSVLLGGDTDVLPARYGFSAFGPPGDRDIPTDLYFGCLDGNWNRDGDAVWGEAAVSVQDPGDSTDLFTEVNVGRLPASTPSAVSAIVAKVMRYENPTHFDYQDEVVLLGEVLSPVNWDGVQAISVDGADYCENLASEVSGCVAVARLYENDLDFPGSQPLTLQATLDQLNVGCGIVNHVGHGYRYNMSCGNASLQNFHALGLTNTDELFVLFMLNCTAAAFDYPCLAEAFLAAGGGAVAVLGASRSAYSLPMHNYNRTFFDAIYQQGVEHLGDAYAASRLPYTANAWFDTADHYSHLLYALLGDPEMVLHTCTLGTTAATYPSTIGLGLTNIQVHVTVDGSPREGALVCLQKGTEEYQFGTTDGAGDVTLPFRAQSPGLVQVTIGGRDMRTLLGNISALTGGLAYVRPTEVVLDDSPAAPSSGNADGVLDAGETVELTVTFQNTGIATADSVAGTLRISSPWAVALDSTYTLGTIAAGATAVATNQVHFAVQPSTPDGTVLELTFITTSGGAAYTEVVNRVVHHPSMSLVLQDVDDFAPGGNGDGVIQAGETFDLITTFKNYGTGAADGLVATLATSDPDIVIVNGNVIIGRADPVTAVTGAARFRLQENVIAENPLRISLTDNYARTHVDTITLRGPASPAAVQLDASSGPRIILVSCTPNAEPDLAGYHVYRATSALGPWTRVTVDRTIRVALFRDTGLAPTTKYYYTMTAIDASGNESPPAVVSSISTNPAQLAGWPIALQAPTSCPVVVGDITGDGGNEIVAGDEHLNAWMADGVELRDDDGDPQTWGVFVNEIKTITGAPALAELDPVTPGFEVVGLSWDDSNKAFAVGGDGTILPGWPRNPDFTTVQKGYWAQASACDVDGDGRDEVFAPAKNGNLYAWRWNGTPLGASAAFKSGLGTYPRTAPCFADLDSDPQQEIVFAAITGILYVWNPDGSDMAPFPKTIGSECISNPAIGDVDGDDVLDIVMIVEGGSIHVISSKTGADLAGWPRVLPFDGNPKTPSPALADFDGDGKLEIVVAHNDVNPSQCAVRIYDWQGNVRPGWPKLTGGATSESSPIVADVSGDGVPDVLFGNEGGKIYGWDAAGQELAGFPLVVGDLVRSVPYATDVDGDGNINLVLAGWDANVHIWDFPVPYVEAAAQWPTLAHDPQHSGNYRHRIASPTDVGGMDPTATVPPAQSYLAQNRPNPFNPTTVIEYGVAATDTRTVSGAADSGARIVVRLQIFDVRGRLVRTLVRGSQPPGHYRATWDGRDDGGRGVHSGVYFYRLATGTRMQARKLVLLE